LAGSATTWIRFTGLFSMVSGVTAHSLWFVKESGTGGPPMWLGTGVVPGAVLLVLIVLALPLLSLHLAFADATDPQSYTTRQAYDLLAEGFEPGTAGPLVIAVQVVRALDGLPGLPDIEDQGGVVERAKVMVTRWPAGWPRPAGS
jgi:hypothetical protein